MALCPRLFRSASITYHPDADLFLLVNYTHPETQPELKLITNLSYPPSNKRPRNADSTGQISRLVDAMSDVDFEAAVSNTLIPPPLVSQHVSFTTSVTTAPLLLAGTYTKRSRILSQTPWFVDGPADAPDAAKDEHGRVKRTTQSVEEVVTAGILGLLRPEKATFTAGGREDVDVRMLGSGRPFVVEVLNSKIAPSQVTDTMVTKMAAISNAVSHAVGVHDLRVVPKEYFARMRAFEAEKRKHYRCVVWTSKQYDLETFKCKLEVQGGFLLKQKTPLRVLHRRTQTVRERSIYCVSVKRAVNENFFVVDVVAQAGTYIKEFVHGDNGRTIPNVAGLLSCDADIVQLDVTEISGS